MSSKNFGILYIAFGQEYLLMAINSAISVRNTGMKCGVTLVTNIKEAKDSVYISNIFSRIIIVNDNNGNCLIYKTNAIKFTEYEYTLLVDCDTEFRTNLDYIPEILGDSHISAPLRCIPSFTKYNLNDVVNHKMYPHWHTGILIFRDCDKTREFFKTWGVEYVRGNWKADQPSFAISVFNTRDLNVLSLDVSWNLFNRYYGIMRPDNDAVKIYHYVDIINYPRVARNIIDIVKEIDGSDGDSISSKIVMSKEEMRRYRLIGSRLFDTKATVIGRKLFNRVKPWIGRRSKIGFLHKRAHWKR